MLRIWTEMINRCDKTDHPTYAKYGGRGIRYQESWKDFEAFRKDMDVRYQRSLTLKRIDDSKDYTKENCYWVDVLNPDIDVMNYRFVKDASKEEIKTEKFYMYKGELNDIAGFASKYGINYYKLEKLLSQGWTISQALSGPFTRRLSDSRYK